MMMKLFNQILQNNHISIWKRNQVYKRPRIFFMFVYEKAIPTNIQTNILNPTLFSWAPSHFNLILKFGKSLQNLKNTKFSIYKKKRTHP